MKKLGVFFFCFLAYAASFVLLRAPAAVAEGWEWRQTDWTGGPGQAAWYDSSRYDSSDMVDTFSVPGTMRLSHLSRNYTRDPANPVVVPGAPGEWDDGGVFGYPRRRKGGGYEVLYYGEDAGFLVSALGYASSPDGVTWTKYAANPVLERSGPATAWDAGGVYLGPILDEGDRYTMLFGGVDSGINQYYGLATSPDLMHWDRLEGFVFGPGDPGSWEAFIGDAALVREGGGYRLWYTGNNMVTGCVGTATSDDGVNWARDAANPVLGPGSGTWDGGAIWDFHILKRPWAGDFMMVYTASDGAGNTGVGLAFSPDGITWTKHPNPIWQSGAVGSWHELSVGVMSLSFDGGIYKMTLYGLDASMCRSCAEIYSTDGLIWFDNPFGNPTLPYGAAPAWDDQGVQMMVPFLEGNTLRALYSGYGSIAPFRGMGTATAAPGYPVVGSLTSSVFDAGQPTTWGSVTWDEDVPAGCAVGVYVRSGDVPVPDGTWSGWSLVGNGGMVPGGPSRFIQYQVVLNGSGNDTPVVSNLAIDFTAVPVTWYFAEGYTGAGFDEYITIQNPNPADAHVWVTYYTPSAAPELRPHTVPADSRYTIYVNSDLGEGEENSFVVESDQPVIAERPMYFRYSGTAGHDWQGGSDAMGSTGLSRRWYFAEGYTGEDFEEYLTVQNPNAEWATLDVTYFVNGGAPIRKQHRVAPTSRYTINVNEDAGAGLEVSAMLQADRPILAERPMYFNFDGRMDGGHIVMGSPNLAQDWYLAEGATFYPFSEFITIQNPNAAPATVAIAYYTPAGAPITSNHTIDPNSRATINVGDDAGVASEISTYLHSNLPILVERPMYFDQLHGGLPGGHCAVGVNSPSTQWFFAEGFTGAGFDEWLTVQNPGGAAANLTVTYYVLGGTPITKNHTVDPHSRFTIDVGQDAGEGLELSAYVQSDKPVICERPMYFFYQGTHAYNWPGGHDSQGFAP